MKVVLPGYVHSDGERETTKRPVQTKSRTGTRSSGSTEKGNLSLNFTPGMTIKGNANNYILEKILGSGAFGLVARCRIEGTMKYVALKIMAESDKREFLNEVQILESLNKSSRYNTCFIRLNDSFVYRNFLCQELELLDENLLGFSEKRGATFKVAEIRAIAQQMLEALSALKHLGVTHTDIKPDNVMLVNHKAQPFRVKLIDFGLARKTGCLPQEGNLEVLAFRAPEITLGLPRDEAIDTWSLGCLLSFMFLNCIVFPRENKYDNLRMIVKLLGQPDQKLLDKGTLVSDYFIKAKKGSERSWRFKTLKQYEKKKGKVRERADPAYDDLTSLDDFGFSPCMRGFSLAKALRKPLVFALFIILFLLFSCPFERLFGDLNIPQNSQYFENLSGLVKNLIF
uniref:Protein kinase domain-containing protein n=1 Tax=Nothobranchius furzeri TaxID=105023 RepID=A0A8C6LU27_NOTFU